MIIGVSGVATNGFVFKKLPSVLCAVYWPESCGHRRTLDADESYGRMEHVVRELFRRSARWRPAPYGLFQISDWKRLRFSDERLSERHGPLLQSSTPLLACRSTKKPETAASLHDNPRSKRSGDSLCRL